MLILKNFQLPIVMANMSIKDTTFHHEGVTRVGALLIVIFLYQLQLQQLQKFHLMSRRTAIPRRDVIYEWSPSKIKFKNFNEKVQSGTFKFTRCEISIVFPTQNTIKNI